MFYPNPDGPKRKSPLCGTVNLQFNPNCTNTAKSELRTDTDRIPILSSRASVAPLIRRSDSCAHLCQESRTALQMLPSQQQIRSSGGGSFPFGTICMFHWGFPSLRTLLKIYFCRWGKTAALWLLLWRHLWYFYPRTPRLWRDSALTQRSTRLTRLFWRMWSS